MKRALLISTQGIGNTVLMTPAIRLLAEAGYQVDVVVSDNGSHEILSASPYVNEQYLWIERDGSIRNLLRLRSKLRLVEYETAYALYPNGKRENTLLALTRAARKKCYVDRAHYLQFLNFLPFSDKITFHRQHDALSNIDLVGADKPRPGYQPELSLPQNADEFAGEFYEAHGLRDKFVVAVHPGGGNLAKQWSEENYIELCAGLAKDESIKLLVFGSNSETDFVDRITSTVGSDAITVCGLDLARVSALLQRSQLLIGNDSALIHVASALDIPVVAIWGYTDFRRTAPFNSQGLLIRINYPCSPCYDFATGYIEDCQYHLKCIKNISAETVQHVVSKYITLLTSRQPLDPQVFQRDPAVERVERLDGRCVMIDVLAGPVPGTAPTIALPLFRENQLSNLVGAGSVDKAAPALPFVSVIMPVRNEAAFIERSVGSVVAQDYPRERMEILIADGMSEDATREIISSLQQPYPNVKLIDNPGKIVAAGLNAALRQARGEIIVRVDGHCEVATDYVRRCVAHLAHDLEAVGGPVETVGESRTARAIAAAMSSSFGVGGSAFRVASSVTQFTDTVAFPAYLRSAIDRGGPFDEELVRNQDDEYNYRLRKLGVKLLLASDVRSRYYSRATFAKLASQYFQYGFWKVRVMQKHPRQMQLRQFIPPLFVAALLAGLLMMSIFPAAGYFTGLIISVYAVAVLAAAISSASKAEWRMLPLLPVAFAILHFSYGLGFLFGLARFWNRWGDHRTRASNSSLLRDAAPL